MAVEAEFLGKLDIESKKLWRFDRGRLDSFKER